MSSIDTQYTQPGQSTQQLFDTLSSITGKPAASAMASAYTMQGNEPDYLQQVSNQLYNQSSLPQLQNSYNDLAKIFPLYLHDSQMSQKYSSGQNINPYANSALIASSQGATTPISGEVGQSAVNPYLAPTDKLLNSTQTSSGFTQPGLITSAMGVPINATINTLNTLNTTMGGQQSILDSLTNLTAKNYEAKMNALSNLATVLGNAYTEQLKRTTSDTFTNKSIAQDVQSGMTLTNTMEKYGTQKLHDDILKLYNTYSPWGPATEPRNVLASKFGISKAYLDELGLPTSKEIAKAKKEYDTRISKIKAFGDLVKIFDKNAKQYVGGNLSILENPNAVKQFSSQKGLYLGGISKDLGISRSNVRFKDLESKMPGDIISLGAEGSIRGHLTTLLDLTQLVLYVNPTTGETGVKTRDELGPSDQIIDPGTDDYNLVKGIIGGLK